MLVPKPNALIKSRSIDVVRHDAQENTVNFLHRTGMLDHGSDEFAAPAAPMVCREYIDMHVCRREREAVGREWLWMVDAIDEKLIERR